MGLTGLSVWPTNLEAFVVFREETLQAYRL